MEWMKSEVRITPYAFEKTGLLRVTVLGVEGGEKCSFSVCLGMPMVTREETAGPWGSESAIHLQATFVKFLQPRSSIRHFQLGVCC